MLVYTIRVLTQLALGYLRPVVVHKGGTLAAVGSKAFYEVPFVCGPTDIDSYSHMNNANFLRVAELSRWRIFPQSGMLKMASDKKAMFLVVENHATYIRQIKPFQRFVVRTSISTTDNKWLWYTHSFESVKPDAKTGKHLQYASILCKAVLKEGSGKTIRALEYRDMSDFNRQLIQVGEDKAL